MRLLAILAVTLVALGLRLRAVNLLPIDYDEDDYLAAGQRYAAALRTGDWDRLINYDFNSEHPPLAKLVYGVSLLSLPPGFEIPEQPSTYPPARVLPRPHFTYARLTAAAFGTLEVLAVALLNPLAALFLGIYTWQIKYTSQIMLEPLPSFTSAVMVLAYVKWRMGNGRRRNGWLALSGVMLGLTAASKYTYCIAALAIIADWLWATFPARPRRAVTWARWLAPVFAWGLLSIVVFVAFDPRLWNHGPERLWQSILYHASYAESQHVKDAGYPMWQPLVWLSKPVPWHPGVFLFLLDLPISLLALLGVWRLWQSPHLRVMALWLTLTLAFLLWWNTKWPQYILMLTAPLAVAAAEGFKGCVAEPVGRWFQRVRQVDALPGGETTMKLKIWNARLMLALSLAMLGPLLVARANDTPPPQTVTIPGTLQSELGCSGDWQPDCANTALTYDAEDDVWQGVFQVQPNDDQDKKGPRYKVALNGSWSENYGKNAASGGADIPLVVTQPTLVKFYYDHKTHWVTDNFNTPIVVATGDFQSRLGCKKDNDPGCLRSWLQDPDGDGTYSFVTTQLPAGTYTVELGINEAMAELTGDLREFTVKNDGDEIYFGYTPAAKEFLVSTEGAPHGNLVAARAHWVTRDTLVWNLLGSSTYTYTLYYSPTGSLTLGAEGITGGEALPLTFSRAGPGDAVLKKYPHLAGFVTLKLSAKDVAKVPDILKGQIAVMAQDKNGKLVDATGVQLPGVLDDLYPYTGPLGVTFDGDVPTLDVWAPTAKSVTLQLFDNAIASDAQELPMALDQATGVWSVSGQSDWKGKFYLYAVQVYVPSTGKIETNLVTDPYSLSLSTNSQRSQIVDLTDDALKPPGWDTLASRKPALAAPEDIVIYELHIRDFSIADQTVPEDYRGTYMAFTVKDSNGMKHLAALAQAGLTHIHLLPAFDIASVSEDKSTWESVDEAALAALPPDSDQQATAVSAIKGSDGFNWGYDPWHYTTPEGSYATDPAGVARIVEFREMVQALNETGLRVVMDVVYNHTTASGQSDKSVLDRVVPGYYHRLDADGDVEKSTCCENTATEHNMMRKLMIDSVLTWAKEYKVDGFRFDLMGHHMLADMQAVRAALDGLTLEKDGVDGKSIYVYGEGWDFGEVANNARGVNATQLNIGGTGIGVFNDRLRDGVRGGSPFSDPREQGFATGLVLADNAAEQRPMEDQQTRLFEYTDWIRLGLAGNLSSYELVRADGQTVPGRLIYYNNAPAGYTADPQENIVYVAAHDNETLFDAVQAKAPAEATLADRIRMNNLALSTVMFSQGVPFFHAGDDILRSKSLDRNSYDSGDWFNQLDWTYQSNNWGVGLPIEGSDRWDIFRPLLADPKLKPSPADIQNAAAYFRELLQIRKSSPLFRLRTAAQIEQSVSFPNSGPEQVPGLIVMRLSDVDGLDQNYKEIVVLFNARPEAVTFRDASFASRDYVLHPVQQNSVDAVVETAAFDAADGAFTVPGRTTAVFVVKAQAAPEPTSTVAALTAVPPTSTPAPSAGPTLSSTEIAWLAGIVVVIGLGAFYLWRRRRK